MQKASSVNFSKLLELCAKAQPKMRIRFSTSNPQDLTLDVVETMVKYNNICNHIHLPVQSVIRIEEVKKKKSCKIRDIKQGENISQFPGLPKQTK